MKSSRPAVAFIAVQKLDIAYFDQYRADLDPEKTVMDNVADGKQDIEVNGVKRHVLGYLQDFLFPPKRAMTPDQSPFRWWT